MPILAYNICENGNEWLQLSSVHVPGLCENTPLPIFSLWSQRSEQLAPCSALLYQRFPAPAHLLGMTQWCRIKEREDCFCNVGHPCT